MEPAHGVYGGGCAPKNLMGSALQSSDLVSSGGTAPLKAFGPCHLGKMLFFTATCGNALPEPRACGCAAMVIISAGSVQGQREPSATSVPPSLFHREFLLRETQGVAGEVCWEQGAEAGHSPRSCPTSAVKELLWLPCAGAMNISVPVPSSLC